MTINQASIETAKKAIERLPEESAVKFLTGMAKIDPQGETSIEIRRLRDEIKYKKRLDKQA